MVQKASPLVVIVGETASGKSALALNLAKKFKGELICADSWTVYSDFDIGTAKPSAAQRQKVPHHLLDIADPRKGFSAAVFKRRAMAAIQDVSSRGKLPILVGGSGLYIDSVIFDYRFLPAGPAGQREALNKLSLRELLDTVKQAHIDTSGIDVRNKRRLIRLLETNGTRPTRSRLRQHTLILGLQTDSQALEGRITRRVDDMLAAELEPEVRKLVKTYGWEVEPMKGIGYREFKDYLAGSQTLEQTRQRIIRSTIQLAKKQRTWFRSSRYDQPSANSSHFSAETGPNSLDVSTDTSYSSKPVSPQKLSTHTKTNNRSVMAERNYSIQWLQNAGQAELLVQNFLSK